MKVSIGDGLYIHIRVHQREDGDGFDFYSLHEIIKNDTATCIFKKGIQHIQLSQFLICLFFRRSIDLFQLLDSVNYRQTFKKQTFAHCHLYSSYQLYK